MADGKLSWLCVLTYANGLYLGWLCVSQRTESDEQQQIGENYMDI